MEFDRDRMLKLAGIKENKSSTDTPQKRTQATSGAGLIKESRRSPRCENESRDLQRLRELIELETRSVVREITEGRNSGIEFDISGIQGRRSLSEAAAMGFYGPGFGGSPRLNRQSFLSEGISPDVADEAADALASASPSELPQGVSQEDADAAAELLRDPREFEKIKAMAVKLTDKLKGAGGSLEEAEVNGQMREGDTVNKSALQFAALTLPLGIGTAALTGNPMVLAAMTLMSYGIGAGLRWLSDKSREDNIKRKKEEDAAAAAKRKKHADQLAAGHAEIDRQIRRAREEEAHRRSLYSDKTSGPLRDRSARAELERDSEIAYLKKRREESEREAEDYERRRRERAASSRVEFDRPRT